jgi:hypothetical protein
MKVVLWQSDRTVSLQCTDWNDVFMGRSAATSKVNYRHIQRRSLLHVFIAPCCPASGYMRQFHHGKRRAIEFTTAQGDGRIRRLLLSATRVAAEAVLYPDKQGFNLRISRTLGLMPKGAGAFNGALGSKLVPNTMGFVQSILGGGPGRHIFDPGASLANTFILFPVFIVANFKLLLMSFLSCWVSFLGGSNAIA